MNFQIPEHRVSMVLYKNRFDKTGESFYGRVHRSNKTLSLENLISLIDERDTGISAHLVPADAPPLCLRFTPSAEVNKSLKKLSVSLVVQSQHDPQIDAVRDLFSQKDNEIITYGKSLRVSGNRIRILGTLEDCGIYCVPQDGSEPIKVKEEHIFTNTPSLVEFFVPPELEKDKQYAIRICTQFSSGKITVKELRTTETDFYLKAV